MDVEVDFSEPQGSAHKKIKQDHEEVLENDDERADSQKEDHDHDDGDDMIEDDDDCENYDYGTDEDYFYDNNDDDDEHEYLRIQAQFDHADLPAGVEASVSWLKASSSKSSTSVVDPPKFLGQAGSVGASSIRVDSSSKNQGSITSSIYEGSNSRGEDEKAEEIAKKYESFKRFDVVEDFSDHHYCTLGFHNGQQPPRAWMKKVQDEWKILEHNLPNTIFVRVYESRMDLLRAVIVGPQGTPYHDGLFVFDVLFPTNYPDVPPMVYYYSGGLRLNPNLYDSGKVCLSLLNTWPGRNATEKWIPRSSTMLQVLVSIQALILNANPYFNEPGYANLDGTREGERQSKPYNEQVFILSLKTMMYTLRRPPKHFEDLVTGHFRNHAHSILAACKAYMNGALVGSLVDGKVPEGTAAKMGGSSQFKESVRNMINVLVSNFTRCGVPDCEQFRIQLLVQF